MTDGRLGDQIRARRVELDVSQHTLAERTGLRQGFLSRVEQGQRNPSILTLKSILGALDAVAVISAVDERIEPVPPVFGADYVEVVS